MLKQTRLIAGLLAVLIIISLTACSAGKKSPAANKDSTDAVLSDLPVYSCTWRMSEFLDNTFYDEYMHDNGQRFRSLKTFTEKLQSSEEITFAPYTCNPVELLDLTIPDQCMVNYGTDFAGEAVYDIAGETATAAEALQVTDTIYDLFPFQVAEGRRFTGDDYEYLGNGRIPVILGAAYKETLSIGDTFEGYYISERFTFEVIGFAEGGSSFYSSGDGRPVPYDRYIIMPFASVSEDSEIGRIILLQQICGLITDENGREHALKQVNEWLVESGLGEWVGKIIISDDSLKSIVQYYLN